MSAAYTQQGHDSPAVAPLGDGPQVVPVPENDAQVRLFLPQNALH